ncbi:METTL5 family protein [Methanochimaera problematica]|nr:METTL5 family protein [Methanoplanus sp. FWC-SCC4]
MFHAFMKGDIEGLSVYDPGCGTGVLSVGASLLKADYVLGVDIDRSAIEIAERNAKKLHADVEFQVADINTFECTPFDTVVMNPPFGAQNKYADRPFIDAALRCGDVVYGIFNKGSLKFLESYTKGRAEIDETISCSFPMKHTYAHHTRECVDIEVEIVRMIKI